ncbi:natural killer cells antigen CD94-like, partial [Otolemur garnettii]|uniref:natural killer cells antigen CD94-like n=1 Tax=Otolemur garnettii TaxID=30611 RepID=UPI0002742C6C
MSLKRHYIQKTFKAANMFVSDSKQAFMHSSQHFYWIGLTYNEEHAAWFWEDGSSFSRDLFPLIKTPNPKKCTIYKAMNSGMDESCEEENRYICKLQVI